MIRSNYLLGSSMEVRTYIRTYITLCSTRNYPVRIIRRDICKRLRISVYASAETYEHILQSIAEVCKQIVSCTVLACTTACIIYVHMCISGVHRYWLG